MATSRCHEIVDQQLPHILTERWVGGAPQLVFDYKVATVRSHWIHLCISKGPNYGMPKLVVSRSCILERNSLRWYWFDGRLPPHPALKKATLTPRYHDFSQA
ncbi:hypothetical protein D3C85_1425250 [compost metagenome]